jgi:hypothetical protein
MIIGYTGTRNGMTESQALTVWHLVANAQEGHHGDCVGGDEQFHRMLIDREMTVVIHPPTNPRWRAHCDGPRVFTMPEEEYLARNRSIVEAVDIVIATPKETSEPMVRRGQGTWSAIRYARKLAVPLFIVWPYGTATAENRDHVR